MQALQSGVTYTNLNHHQFHRQAFNDGYFPVSRNISTFPSTSDVAWTDIFGDRPLPGYQRSYFSEAENREIIGNSVSSSMEHERQMHWQAEGGFHRSMGYMMPLHAFKYELGQVTEQFLNSKSTEGTFYAYMRSTDDAQHMAGDIFAMLCLLDDQLKELRARYRAREVRELEILILSDHGHNRAGAGQRVEVRSFLKRAGYRIAHSIVNPKDVVLPTCGIESWVEIHNAPAETERLAQLLLSLEGVDLLTARLPDQTNRFLVLNAKGERASIEWHDANNSYRYTTENGDPLDYRPVVEALAQKHQLDADGFATADHWMAETITHRYPLALERIAQAHTRITLNPANILLSLRNGYVHSGWLVKKLSQLKTLGGTHGNLDALNSAGILLSSFAPTQDTSTSRVAAQYDGFPGMRNYRTEENGAEWVAGKEQALARIARTPFESTCRSLPGDALYLRAWTLAFAHLNLNVPVEVTIEKVLPFPNARMHRDAPKPIDTSERHLTLNPPITFADPCAYERVYALPPDLNLEPEKTYRISGWVTDRKKHTRIFNFPFSTDHHGLPVAY
jgi:hypothetical protein